MKRAASTNLVELGLFSMGVSYAIYSFIQYILTPICWWVTNDVAEIGVMNEVFAIFEGNQLNVFTLQSLGYSLVGIIAFFAGYLLFPERNVRKRTGIVRRRWDLRRAEVVFWGLLISGFSLKILKLMMGVSIAEVVEINIKHSYFSDPLFSFLLSFNWFHLLALIVINVAYQEAKNEQLSAQSRLKIIAYGYTFLFLAVTLTTGGKTATIFPVFGILIIKKYYSNNGINYPKVILALFALVVSIFAVKQLLAEYFEAEGYSTEFGLGFVLVYNLFNRLNMSHVMAAVIQKGQQAFPDGTLGQFLVNMSFYGSDKTNVFDGNDFGRAIGVAAANDFSTGVASTNMGEWFINFGVPGIILGMLLTGVLYKIIFHNCRQRFPFFVMLYSLMWPILIHGMESPVSVLYSASIKMIALCLLVHFAIVFRFSRPSIQKTLQLKARNNQRHELQT